jgi:protein SCO1/2
MARVSLARGVWLVPAVVAVAALGAVGWQAATRHLDATSLPVYGAVPEAALTDQDGQAWTTQSMRGRVWIADFIFTRCAGQCPLMTSRMRQLAKALSGQPGIRFVSVSVDPVHDTPEALKTYARHHEVDLSRWVFVVGPEAVIQRLCLEGFKLGYGQDPDSAMEPVIHSSRFVLVDADGAIRGYYEAGDDAETDRLAADARRLAAGGR